MEVCTTADTKGEVSKAASKASAKCQSAVVKALDKCWNAYLKSYSTCAKKGLKGSIADADGLEACRGDDPKGKVAKVCDEKLQAVSAFLALTTSDAIVLFE